MKKLTFLENSKGRRSMKIYWKDVERKKEIEKTGFYFVMLFESEVEYHEIPVPLIGFFPKPKYTFCYFEAILKVFDFSKTKEFRSYWLWMLVSTRVGDNLMKKLTFLENSNFKQPVIDFLQNLNMRQTKIVKEVCGLCLQSHRHWIFI